MWQFLKYILATIIGIFLFIFFMGLFGVGLATVLTKKEKVTVKSNTVLKASFSQTIPDRTPNSPFGGFDFATFKSNKVLGLNDVLKNIEKATKDSNIKGIYLELGMVPTGWATLEEIRDALLKFKEEGKFVVAYGEQISQRAYYLAAVADEVYLNPEGMMELKGFSAEIPFFKNALDNLGIEPEIFFAGKFKSATEPFRLEKMSEANRLQTKEYLDSFYDIYVERVSSDRNMSAQKLRMIIDSLQIRKAEDARAEGMVDELFYIDQVQAKLRSKLGLENEDKIEFMSMNKYDSAPESTKIDFGADKIAVVYAEGSIASGVGEEGSIGSDSYVKILQEVRKNDNIKAVVLRVNSPGGSALASDIILREVKLLREIGKPVVASMGNVAASGGYYISADADKIYAEDNTITGSIGVFGMLANMSNFYDEQLGITFDRVKTSPNSDFPTSPLLTHPMSPTQKEIFQTGVDEVYDTFLSRVSEGRNLPMDSVASLAQGRVYSGRDALEIGLVDEIGSIEDAVVEAARLAELENYRTTDYPKKEDPIQKIMKDLRGEVKAHFLAEELGPHFRYYKQIKGMLEGDVVQMRMPFEIEVR